jgi:hypothetical protein
MPALNSACYAPRWEERALPNHSWTKFIEAKRKELQRLNNAYKNTLSNAKVELLQGFGKVVDANTVDVGGKKYTVSWPKLQLPRHLPAASSWGRRGGLHLDSGSSAVHPKPCRHVHQGTQSQ